ncbi:MAG: hypothetical protein CVV22_05200 [Ignavibacteriae bacterium HGW-Ignavibacteriae-1]|jgi:hypothetical protein|nr:MAG: hypothetical protein CVV22_05200 [Ignavibacteriae bacterium HGW-Ignavibacteriae-1]
MEQMQKSNLPNIAIASSAISLISLLLLHFVSPEFEPNWRMVSEYALGNHRWLVSLFFIFWGLSSILLAATLWNHVSSRAAKVGVILLFISGVGASLAAYFDVSQPMGHGIAGLLGIPTVPIATLLISYHLSKKPEWFSAAKTMKLLAHGTWISLLLMVITMFVMMSGFQNAGIQMGPDSPPPSHVPDGVVALVGYVNRILILVDIFWLIYVAKAIKNIHK